jgi:hypothetical protein
MTKQFLVGEVLLFQREPGAKWELCEYVSADREATGWHTVRDDTGFRVRHYVPSRRLKLKAVGT